MLEAVRDEAGELGCEVCCPRAGREAHGATPPLEATCEQHETAEPCLSEAARISTLCAESFRPALVGRQCNVIKHHQCSKKSTTVGGGARARTCDDTPPRKTRNFWGVRPPPPGRKRKSWGVGTPPHKNTAREQQQNFQFFRQNRSCRCRFSLEIDSEREGVRRRKLLHEICVIHADPSSKIDSESQARCTVKVVI